LFAVVNFLKYVVTEVLFSNIALRHDISQGSVATNLRCGGIFSDSICYKFSPDSDSEQSLKIGQYLMKLYKAYKSVPNFWGHRVDAP